MCPMGVTFTSEIKPNPLQKPNIKPNTENTKLINQKTFCLSTCLELGLHRRHVLHEGKRLQSRQNWHRVTLRLITSLSPSPLPLKIFFFFIGCDIYQEASNNLVTAVVETPTLIVSFNSS
ncbi:hypothetical protein Bca4012_072670 [Brassica carinata]